MKAKTFLKIVKRNCNEKNCENRTCPMAYGEYSCLITPDTTSPEEWDIKKLIKRAKKAKRK